MSAPLRSADLAALFVLAAGVQGGAYLAVPHPGDYDQAYYLSVARHLASGDGAVIGAVWNHTFLPEALPHAADVHWMPLTSRLLALGELVSPEAYRLVGALLAGCWAPLAALLARELQLPRGWALAAGVAAATGTCWVARVAAPDTYGVVGLLGSLALLAVANRRVFWVSVCAALLALTRTDGFLFGFALSAGLAWGGQKSDRFRSLAPALAAVAASGAWTVRNHVVFGASFWSSRAAAAQHTDYLAWAGDLPIEPLSVLDRAVLVGAHLPDALTFWLLSGLGVGTLFAAVGIGRERNRGFVVAAGSYWLLLPLVASALAPAVAWHGTVFRSGVAVFPALCAVAAAGAYATSGILQERRSFSPAAVPMTAMALLFALTAFTATRAVELQQGEPDPCAPLADVPEGEVVFAYDALYVELRCRRPTVALFAHTPPERVSELAERYAIRYALTSPRPEGAAPPDTTVGPLAGWARQGRLAVAPGASLPDAR